MKTLRGFLTEANKKAIVTFMIGPPGVGKTTYVKKEGLKNVLSRDDIVMNHGYRLGLTDYNLIFSKIDQNSVNKELNSKFDKLVKDGKNFVIDMTMMNKNQDQNFYQKFLNIIEKLLFHLKLI